MFKRIQNYSAIDSRKAYAGRRFKLAPALLFGLLIVFAVAGHTSRVAAASCYPLNGTTIYPTGCTANIPKAPGSNFSGPSGAANVDTVSNGSYWLWCANGNIHTQQTNPGHGGCSYNDGNINGNDYASRPQGYLNDTSTYDVIAQAPLAQTGSITVTVIDACKVLKDNYGWEDHIQSANSPSNGGLANHITAYVWVNGNPVAQRTCPPGNTPQNNLTITIPGWAFTSSVQNFGYDFQTASIKVQDTTGTSSEKSFSMKVSNGAYIGPADQTYNPSGGYTNMQDPTANNNYALPGLCAAPPGGSWSNCPGYGNLNRPLDPNPPGSDGHTYNFYFSPDCTYQNQNSFTLKWRDGGGNPFVTQYPTEDWELDVLSGGNWVSVDTSGNHGGYWWMQAGNDSVPEALQFGQVYRWQWHNVDQGHGISVNLPFSEFTATSGFQTALCPVQMQGNVFKLDSSGNRTPDSGVGLTDCRGNNTSTDPNGNYWFWEVPTIPFCVHVTTGAPAGYLGQYVRPWGGAPIQGYRGCGPYGGNYTNPRPNYCKNLNAYDNQFVENVGGPTGNGWDRDDASWEGGYDFVYYPQSGPHGYVNGANCVGAAGLGAVWGWALDQDYPTATLNVAVLRQNKATGAISGYNPPAQAGMSAITGTTVAFAGVSTETYAANINYAVAGHGFAIPVDPAELQMGTAYNLLVYAIGVSDSGVPDGVNGPNTFIGETVPPYQSFAGLSPVVAGANSMLACAQFTTSSSSTASLAPTPENPSSYTVNSTVNVAYKAGTDPTFNTAVNMACNILLTDTRGGVGPVVIPPGVPSNAYNCVGPYPKGPTPINNKPTGPTDTPLQPGDNYCPTVTLGYQSGVVQSDGTIFNGVASPPAMGGCSHVTDEPYVNVYGNGVSAAGGVTANGACNGGELTSWNDDTSSPAYAGYGSGAQLNAIATIAISGFASGQNTTSFNSPSGHPGQGLSFANTVNNTGFQSQDTPNMGGNDGGQYCLDEEKMPPAASSTPLGANIDVPTQINGASKTYTAPANSTINGGSITAGTNAAIYVNGDVYISAANGGITYSNGTNWSWTATNDTVPSFAVVAVGGSIFIDKNVSTLDGLFIAQKVGAAGGQIYDCANGPGTANLVIASNMFSQCNTQLVVHGDFVADQINLMRTAGSLRDEIPQAPASAITVRGSNHASCTPTGAFPCVNTAGNGVYDLDNFNATYAMGNPALSDYVLTLNYSNNNTSSGLRGWPPPGSGSYKYNVNVKVNGVTRISNWQLATSGGVSSANVDLGALPANASITIDWNNNYWIDVNGNAELGAVTDFSYDPNMEFDSIVITPGTALPPAPLACSHLGGSGIPTRSCAGEVFDFSPELYLGKSQLTSSNNGAVEYQSFTSLPPVL